MSQVFCKLLDSPISKIDRRVFSLLEEYLISSGQGADKDEFAVIRDRLKCPPILSPEEFVEEVIYVILASGFRQKVAKAKFAEIMEFIHCHGDADVVADNLLPMFGNVQKINAICRVWHDRKKYCGEFYAIPEADIDARLDYLETLPFIGRITRNHIARNLGINKVKYDIWIQRLGIALCGKGTETVSSPVSDVVCYACNKMFSEISNATNLPIGYIDVVLWKACQIGLLIIPHQ